MKRFREWLWGDQPSLPTPSLPVQWNPAPPTIPAPLIPGLVGSATSVGPRRQQQDTCFHVRYPGFNLVVIADGVGSLPCSGLAANLAVTSLVTHLCGNFPQSPTTTASRQWLWDGFEVANAAVLALQHEILESIGQSASTTLLAALEVGDQILVAGVGDGNAHLFSGSGQRQGRLPVVEQQLSSTIGSMAPHISMFSTPRNRESGSFIVIGSDGLSVAHSDPQMKKAPRHDDSYIAQEVWKESCEVFAKIGRSHSQVMPSERGRAVRQAILQTDVQASLESWTSGRHIHTDREIFTHSADNRSIGVLADETCLRYWMDHGSAL